MILFPGPFSEGDFIFVTNYINTLFPNSMLYQHVALYAEETAMLLRPVAKFMAVINTDLENEVFSNIIC